MPIAYPTTTQPTQLSLSEEELASLYYHDVFEYPLTMAELLKWTAAVKVASDRTDISFKNGFYFVGENEGVVLKRLMKKRISTRKIEIAKDSAKILSLIPTVKMIGVTGALAMENASDESDVDLMIITKKGSLWTTRLLTYFLLRTMNYALRKPGDRNQKDKLCLNMWLDESDLVWDKDKRNIYTAHEIAQVMPIVNRDQTYERFITKNKWIRNYWPNAVRVSEKRKRSNRLPRKSEKLFTFRIFEKIAYKIQYAYMKKKITRETVTPTRALFHPVDWSKYVLRKLSS